MVCEIGRETTLDDCKRERERDIYDDVMISIEANL